MSQLNLPACPVCHEPDSLERHTKTIQDTTYVWYDCRQCRSVLLWLGGERWAYQQVGPPDRAYLLKQPLTHPELQEMATPPRPADGVARAGPVEEPAAPTGRAEAASVLPPSAPLPSGEDEHPAGERKRGSSRAFRLALGLIVLLAIAGLAAILLLASPAGRPQPTAPVAAVATEVARATDVAEAPGAPEPTATASGAAAAVPVVGSPTPRPTATWVPTLTPRAAGPMATPDDELLARLATVEAGVQEIRGLQPTAPISRTFVARADLVRLWSGRFDRAYPPAQIEQTTRVWTALGLIPEQYDAAKMLRSLYISQVLGLYDPQADLLYVVPDISAGAFDLFAQIAYAHEYALALQDQYTDLHPLLDQAQLNDDELLARQALVEGYATQIMGAYAQTLPTTDDDWLALMTRDLRGSGGAWYNLPAIIRDTFPLPYAYGSFFIQSLVEEESWQAVDAAFAHPPVSTEQILHPDRYLAGDEPAVVALSPLTDTLGADWHLVKANTLGELQLLYQLAEGLDTKAPYTAAEGWDGDRYALYANDTAEVLVLSTVWDSAQDREEFVQAFTDHTVAQEATPPTRSGDSETWWDLTGRTLLLTWSGTGALIVIAPDAATVAKVRERL